MVKSKILKFVNSKTGKATFLFMGVDDKKRPVYQFDSKEIPITGEFTGYPKTIVVEWLKSIGYTFEGIIANPKGNTYANGYALSKDIHKDCMYRHV